MQLDHGSRTRFQLIWRQPPTRRNGTVMILLAVVLLAAWTEPGSCWLEGLSTRRRRKGGCQLRHELRGLIWGPRCVAPNVTLQVTGMRLRIA
jgi:hypothetical protein